MSDYSELKKRAEAATDGPWIEQDDEDSAAGAIFIVPESDIWIPPICRITSERDAAYVAAANPHEILGIIAEIDQLKAELECACGDLRQAMQIIERDQKDAERYRWIRNNQLDALEIMEKFVGEQMEYCTEEELDAAIDCEISEEVQP